MSFNWMSTAIGNEILHENNCQILANEGGYIKTCTFAVCLTNHFHCMRSFVRNSVWIVKWCLYTIDSPFSGRNHVALQSTSGIVYNWRADSGQIIKRSTRIFGAKKTYGWLAEEFWDGFR